MKYLLIIIAVILVTNVNSQQVKWYEDSAHAVWIDSFFDAHINDSVTVIGVLDPADGQQYEIYSVTLDGELNPLINHRNKRIIIHPYREYEPVFGGYRGIDDPRDTLIRCGLLQLGIGTTFYNFYYLRKGEYGGTIVCNSGNNTMECVKEEVVQVITEYRNKKH